MSFRDAVSATIIPTSSREWPRMLIKRRIDPIRVFDIEWKEFASLLRQIVIELSPLPEEELRNQLRVIESKLPV